MLEFCPMRAGKKESRWTQWPQRSPSARDQICFQCIPLSLENDTILFSAYEQWEATSFCFSLFCFSWPHALTYVFPSTMCHRLRNLIVGTAWVGAACCAWWGMGEWSSERSYMMYLDEIDSQTILFKETHTHSTLLCVMNSGAGPHDGIS